MISNLFFSTILIKFEDNLLLFIFLAILFLLFIFISYQIKFLKAKAKRDYILRKMTETIRTSLDIDKMKQSIVNVTGETFNTDRCYLITYNLLEEAFADISYEYLAKEEIGSSEKNLDIDKNIYSFFLKQTKKNDFSPIQVLKDDFLQKKVNNPNLENFINELGIETYIAVPIWQKQDKLHFLIMQYIDKKIRLKPDDEFLLIEFAKQVSIAIQQSDLYEEIKKQVERQKISQNVINIIRGSLDLDGILYNVCKEILKIFDIQRVFIGKTNFKEKQHFTELTNIDGIEKISNQNTIIFDQVIDYWEDYIKIYKTTKVINDVKKSDMPKHIKNIYNNINTKSLICIPIKSKEEIWGALFLSTTIKYKIWTNEEISFLEGITTQIDVAIKQAELYENERATAQREVIIRQVIEMINQSRDIHEIINTFVVETGKFLKARRVFFSGYDDNTKIFSTPRKDEEYLESSKVHSFSDLGKTFEPLFPFFCETVKKHKQPIIIPDIEKFLEENKLLSTMNEKNISVAGSMIIFPLLQNNYLLGGVVFVFYLKKAFTDDEITFLKTLANQASNAIYQSMLYQKEKQSLARETLIRKIIETIRSSLNIEDTLTFICRETAKILNVQRSTMVMFPAKQDSETFILRKEYKASSDLKGFSNISEIKKVSEFWQNFLRTKNKILAINNMEEFDGPDFFKKSYISIGVKSAISISISNENDVWGSLTLTDYEKYREWSNDEKNLLETISQQIYIAVKQSELYENEKRTAEREALLRKLANIIRSSLDIKQIKKNIVNAMGKILNADRCFILEYDSNGKIIPLDEFSEYLGNQNKESLIGIDLASYNFDFWTKWFKRYKKEIFFNDFFSHIKENHLEGSGIEKYAKDLGLQAGIGVPIFLENKLTFLFVVNFEKIKVFDSEEIDFIKLIIKQLEIGLHQARLYTEIKEKSERETLLKQIKDTIQSSLDIKIRKKNIVDAMGKAFNADICILIEGDKNTKNLAILDEFSEYRASLDLWSFIGFDFGSAEEIKYMREQNVSEELFIQNIEEFILKQNLKNTLEDKFFKKTGMKTAWGIPLFYQNDFIGILCLYYIKDYKIFSEEEKDFIRVLAAQIGNALHQSMLYDDQRKIAQKETVLKEIISEIKLTRDLNQAYNKLLHKLAKIFNLNRTLFLESSPINPDELKIKYEYVIDREDLTVNNLVFPQVCIDDFLNLIKNLQPLTIDNVEECHPEQTYNFFKKYKIRALMSVPLVKYNKEIKVLGFIVLCSEEPRQWSDEDVELIKIISDSVVSVIWEITKFIETEELRDSFVSTIAHDFQVPLVGERTALEYLINYSGLELGSNKAILEEILENNENISTLLGKSIDIYNYESGKKVLQLHEYKLLGILHEAILLEQNIAEPKKITINLKQSEEKFFIVADKKELLKVFCVLIENAVVYSHENNEVDIECINKGNRAIVSIHNFGKPIPLDIQEKIFNRYEMAHAIERKIGAGTGLFLSKRIIEAHKGAIWFETSEEKGTTFYVSLPL